MDVIEIEIDVYRIHINAFVAVSVKYLEMYSVIIKIAKKQNCASLLFNYKISINIA